MSLIAECRQPAVVLVHTADLAAQWKDAAKELLGVDAAMYGGGHRRTRRTQRGTRGAIGELRDGAGEERQRCEQCNGVAQGQRFAVVAFHSPPRTARLQSLRWCLACDPKDQPMTRASPPAATPGADARLAALWQAVAAIPAGTVSTYGAIAARDESGGHIGMVTDEEILDAYRLLAATEGVFVEPASAASVAGLRKAAAEGLVERGETVVCTVTGHGLKDPKRAIEQVAVGDAVPASMDAVAGVLGL